MGRLRPSIHRTTMKALLILFGQSPIKLWPWIYILVRTLASSLGQTNLVGAPRRWYGLLLFWEQANTRGGPVGSGVKFLFLQLLIDCLRDEKYCLTIPLLLERCLENFQRN